MEQAKCSPGTFGIAIWDNIKISHRLSLARVHSPALPISAVMLTEIQKIICNPVL